MFQIAQKYFRKEISTQDNSVPVAVGMNKQNKHEHKQTWTQQTNTINNTDEEDDDSDDEWSDLEEDDEYFYVSSFDETDALVALFTYLQSKSFPSLSKIFDLTWIRWNNIT